MRSCDAGWTFTQALQELERRSSTLVTAACLPYLPDVDGELDRRGLCSTKCNTTSPLLSEGGFSSKQINAIWQAQRHIRMHGAGAAAI